MLARRLTQSGIEQFDAFLASLKDYPTADAPLELLTGSGTSEPIDVEIEAEVRQVRLVRRWHGSFPVTGDGGLLARALDNIVRNAIRHTSAGTTVEIGIDGRPGEAVVSVRDQGPGVPDEMLTAIFKPFFRVESDRGRDSGGIGLGLAIAQRAVVLHHGEISAHNAEPGLLVEVRLPLQVQGALKNHEIHIS